MLRDLLIFLTIGSPDIQLKFPQPGILCCCLIPQDGHCFSCPLLVLHLSFSFRPDLEQNLGFGLSRRRKLFSLPSGKCWTLKLRPTKCMFGLNRKFLNEYLRSNFYIKSSISDTSTILQRKLQHFGIPRKIQVLFLPPRLENQVPIWFLHKNAVLALVCLWGIPASFLRESDS